MTAYAALLRGVNVGGNRSVPAAVLRAIGTDAGFEAPATLLNSGNLVLGAGRPGTPAAACSTADDAARLVRDELGSRLGLEVDVVVVTHADLDAVVAANPFPQESATEPSKVLVTFYLDPPDPERLAAIDLTGFPERMVWAGGVGIAHYPGGAGTSKLTPAFLRRAVGSDGTARNWNTVLKLRELLADRESIGQPID
ncbi:Uncharacterized conserved protein, DUF1697 family [Sanguibacter gelidistatuariae]|uniref:Uncharacterized conserved protein, DUF1697 family n=1 Tax=Sanguibacter gelidistatuariae TaxID=1814289 RepID=A0A1G6LA37_9MICO|nr:DUF1697 domain-containing protein [Sanguibacter gelidistatuariae]SDC39993.1 Uncharacterized conserved protein, DUF1697 family [Sanguibacter gelidistatuariae]